MAFGPSGTVEGRRPAAPAAVAVLALLLAGCSGNPAQAGVASPAQLFPLAEHEARRLVPDARLMGASLIETSDPRAFLAQHRVEFPEARGLDPAAAPGEHAHLALVLAQVEGTPPDARVGDGRAPRVAYTFEASGMVVGIVMDADGTTAFARSWSMAGKGQGTFAWSVDAPQAASALAAADARFGDLVGASHVAVWDLVKPAEGNAQWQVGILRATPAPGWQDDPRMDGDAQDYCELGAAIVDAVTGVVLSRGSLHARGSGKEQALGCAD